MFGSATSADWDPERSDFDFLVEFGPVPEGMHSGTQYFELAFFVQELLGRRVDLVEWCTARKELFRQAAEASAIEWYAA